MKNYLMLIAGLLMIESQLVIGKIPNSVWTGGNLDDHNSPVTIYYGLNESHSKSWAQIDKNGNVGVTYFQRYENSPDEGALLYRSLRIDRSTDLDTVTTGTRLEISVLLFDSLSTPHVFVASSDNDEQRIDHYYKNDKGQWPGETIIQFRNEGGKYIYELSAATGPDASFHLLILKTRSNIDSDDFFDAFINSHLYHLTNVSGCWHKELIHHYDMVYTYDMYIKTLFRQDVKIDKEGHVHVTFGEQINGNNHPDPSRLFYATNKTGKWKIETAFSNNYGSRDDAGWFPSLSLDTCGTPYISCMYVNRVSTGSAKYCKLFLLKRLGDNNWHKEIIAENDNGYYGKDGRSYTGALSHLVFDKYNKPRIIFSDVASSHWTYQNGNVGNVLLVGNIRYGVFENGSWSIKTIYRQPLPTSFVNATEMHGMCLLIPETTHTMHVIGQELKITGWKNQYTCSLVNLEWEDTNGINSDDTGHTVIRQFKLNQNYPNPFNRATTIKYEIPRSAPVRLEVYDVPGRLVKTLLAEMKDPGSYLATWDGTDNFGRQAASGLYFFRLTCDGLIQTDKAMLLK